MAEIKLIIELLSYAELVLTHLLEDINYYAEFFKLAKLFHEKQIPETTRVESLENTAQLTYLVCPCKVHIQAPFSSQIFSNLSKLADTK